MMILVTGHCLQITRCTWQWASWGRGLGEVRPSRSFFLPFIFRSILPVKGKQMATCTSSRKMIQNVSRIRIYTRSKCPDRRENLMFAFHPWVFLFVSVLQAPVSTNSSVQLLARDASRKSCRKTQRLDGSLQLYRSSYVSYSNCSVAEV